MQRGIPMRIFFTVLATFAMLAAFLAAFAMLVFIKAHNDTGAAYGFAVLAVMLIVAGIFAYGADITSTHAYRMRQRTRQRIKRLQRRLRQTSYRRAGVHLCVLAA